MSNYRRLISYIYAYEGGIKGRNIGYAKIEVRSGQCRIYVSVKKIYIGSNDIGVYLLTPGSELLLGRIFIRNGTGEFRINIQAENIDGRGTTMDQCYGLTIHDVENTWQCYTTIWEDAVAHVAEVELADVTAENARKREAGQDNPPAEMKNTADMPPQLPISAEIERELIQEEERLNNAKPWRAEETLEEAEKQPDVGADRGADEAVPEAVEPEDEIPRVTEPEVQSPGIDESEIQSSGINEPEIGTSEILHKKAADSSQKNILKVLQEAFIKVPREPSSKAPEMISEATQEISGTSRDDVSLLSSVPEPEDPIRLEELDRLEKQEAMQNDIWSQMQRRYAKVLAFDYDNGCEILSIKPQDIGLLPREIWVYGNNSFLLHGYYNYRHLILAKLNNPQGNPRYLLGVPGHYFSNEKYMASMFGFPHFVLARKQPQGDGRFGYWYTDIRL